MSFFYGWEGCADFLKLRKIVPFRSITILCNKNCFSERSIFSYCKTKISLYNKSPMRAFRLIAGFLTLSLTFGVVLGDLFHVQEGSSDVQISDHLVAHTDSADVSDTIGIFSVNTDKENCYENPSQVAITTPSGQRTCTTDAIGVTPTLITQITHYQAGVSIAFRGRDAPLFEHASFFAATVSMRV